MIKLLVIPSPVFEQYQADGVSFNSLLDTNYIASVSSVADLASIDSAINEFQFTFCQGTGIELADSPRVGIALASQSDDLNRFKMQDLHNVLEARIETLALRKVNEQPSVGVYVLYPVDENLWVAVQKSLPNQNSDPTRLSLVNNHNFFDSMINELNRTCDLQQIASTNLFTYYLNSRN
ncbi:virion structural protein [Pseudomonas phage Phabio]|uniref:Virion structural protein n=1 Tax=Pseudomonas phage Phabio TaxID=2006668 RepID=A0A1Y0T1V6_9CAUD|nr:virion structural protein [Pseudomonas phage Phabio]ARV76817.1 virion structural protein [Pseudomonas phage Phabio]